MNCSFCRNEQTGERHLIDGPNGIAICAECVDVCREVLADPPPGWDQQVAIGFTPPAFPISGGSTYSLSRFWVAVDQGIW